METACRSCWALPNGALRAGTPLKSVSFAEAFAHQILYVQVNDVRLGNELEMRLVDLHEAAPVATREFAKRTRSNGLACGSLWLRGRRVREG